ncbi:MAG: ATP-dependent RecD-like DNA helicase, partial [Clostridia bacterium]|nr:ATP-dependent RecD-like DNA helicase [Clostridia bacterium]
MAEEQARLNGVVERITFRNEQNGWTVLDLESGGELHKVVGILPLCCVGERVRLSGRWGNHATFGPQFEAEGCEREQPVGADSILRYLAAGSVKGIGPATAAAIVDKFGDDTLRILEQEPEKLTLVRGISRKKALRLGEEYASQFGLREVMFTFSKYGLTPNEALRCWKRWGSSTLEKIQQDPYLLCTPGLRIGFERADALCMAMNGDRESRSRIGAGIQYVLRHNMQNGHTCLPADKLLAAAAGMLEVDLA